MVLDGGRRKLANEEKKTDKSWNEIMKSSKGVLMEMLSHNK